MKNSTENNGTRKSIPLINSFELENSILGQNVSVVAKPTHSENRRDYRMMKHAKRWNSTFYFHYMTYLIIALLIQFLVGSGTWAFPDGKPACDASYEQDMRNVKFCRLFESVEDSRDSLRLLSAFILGGFLLGSVKLWQSRRKAYSTACGATRNVILNVCSIINDDIIKHLLVRWTLLGFELSVLEARGLKKDSKEARAYIEASHLIDRDEWEIMVDYDTPWFWILFKAGKMKRSGDLSDVEFQTFCKICADARAKCNGLLDKGGKDQPSPYVFVCATLININLILHCVYSGLKWAIWTFEVDKLFHLWLEPRMYMEILTLLLYTAIYGMLFDTCTVLYNPYGRRKIDIKHFQTSIAIRNFGRSLAKGEVPATMENPPRNSIFLDTVDEEDEGLSEKLFEFKLANMVKQPSSGLIYLSARAPE